MYPMYQVSSVPMIFDVAVLAIGIYMVYKNFDKGWQSPPVLSGIAFILLALPSILFL